VSGFRFRGMGKWNSVKPESWFLREPTIPIPKVSNLNAET
jgi:hypothetical protein